MKLRIYAYIHIATLVFYLLRPAMPYIDYAVNKDYIAKYLCINRFDPHSCCKGKCYLEKQIKKSLDNKDSKDNNTTKKVQNEDVKEFLCTPFPSPKVFEANITYWNNPETIFSSRTVSAIFIPPQV
jgi:hypothetical protein